MEWVECMDPEMLLSDINDVSRARIEDIEELMEYINRRNLIAEGKSKKD